MAKNYLGELPKIDGVSEVGLMSWHSSRNITMYPKTRDMFDGDLEQLARKFIFKGFGPDKPILNKNDVVITMGSCFADRLRVYLRENHRNPEYIKIPVGLNNTFAIHQFIDWIVTGTDTSEMWYDTNLDNQVVRWDQENLTNKKKERQRFWEGMQKAQCFVITLGLAEVWKDIETGNAFWRGVPKHLMDETRHHHVVSTVSENVENLQKICKLLRSVNNSAPIIYTLSPVPLRATFQPQPCLVSDCISKSILRVALHEFFTEKNDNVWYWPSFEFVKWAPPHMNKSSLGDDHSSLHVNDEFVKVIIKLFIERFFKDIA